MMKRVMQVFWRELCIAVELIYVGALLFLGVLLMLLSWKHGPEIVAFLRGALP